MVLCRFHSLFPFHGFLFVFLLHPWIYYTLFYLHMSDRDRIELPLRVRITVIILIIKFYGCCDVVKLNNKFKFLVNCFNLILEILLISWIYWTAKKVEIQVVQQQHEGECMCCLNEFETYVSPLLVINYTDGNKTRKYSGTPVRFYEYEIVFVTFVLSFSHCATASVCNVFCVGLYYWIHLHKVIYQPTPEFKAYGHFRASNIDFGGCFSEVWRWLAITHFVLKQFK